MLKTNLLCDLPIYSLIQGTNKRLIELVIIYIPKINSRAIMENRHMKATNLVEGYYILNFRQDLYENE